MSKRLQVRVPDVVAAQWEVAAEIAGVSLSNWVAMQVAQADVGKRLDELVAQSESHRRYLGQIAHAVVKEGEPE